MTLRRGGLESAVVLTAPCVDVRTPVQEQFDNLRAEAVKSARVQTVHRVYYH
jgi:hypothetical protein